MAHTVTIYEETLKDAILDGPLTDEDIQIVRLRFDDYLEYVEKELKNDGINVVISDRLHGMSWSSSEDDLSAMDYIRSFWEWLA